MLQEPRPRLWPRDSWAHLFFLDPSRGKAREPRLAHDRLGGTQKGVDSSAPRELSDLYLICVAAQAYPNAPGGGSGQFASSASTPSLESRKNGDCANRLENG